MQLQYEVIAPYLSAEVRRVMESGRQLARAGRIGFQGSQHLIMGLLASETPIMRAVRGEFMISAADVWPALQATLPVDQYLTMCDKPPMTPNVKELCSAAFQRAVDANRKARPADFLFHFFDHASPPVLEILADFDMIKAPTISFLLSREHLESPEAPEPPELREPSATPPKPRVWQSATDRYADWRVRPASHNPQPTKSPEDKHPAPSDQPPQK